MGRRRKEPTRTLRPVRFGIYLKTATFERLRQHALRDNTSITELVERLIEGHLASHRARRRG
jgi:predicted DNA-binding ribbon-helix-helix protein